MPLSSQLVSADRNGGDPKRGCPCHLRGLNPAVSYRPPTTPPHLTSIGEDPMLEQMDVTESSWPGPGFMEPMFPSAPSPAPTPSFPTEESRPSSKPKAKKKAKKKKKAAKKSRPKAKKKPAKKKKKAAKKKRRR